MNTGRAYMKDSPAAIPLLYSKDNNINNNKKDGKFYEYSFELTFPRIRAGYHYARTWERTTDELEYA